MRSYEDIFKTYLTWVVEKTGNRAYEYDVFMANHDKTEAKAILFKMILEHCYDVKDGLYYFCKFIVGDLLDIGYPSPFRYNGLLRKWDKLIKEHKKLSILCARGHGKSVFFSEILNIYDMFLFPYRRVIVESSNQEQANRIIGELTKIVEANEWLRTKIDSRRAERLGYNKGYILGKGFGSEILGEHVDRIVIDDILRSDNKLSDQEIEDFIDMDLDPMLLNRKEIGRASCRERV